MGESFWGVYRAGLLLYSICTEWGIRDGFLEGRLEVGSSGVFFCVLVRS